MSFLKRVLIEKMRVEIAFFDMIRALGRGLIWLCVSVANIIRQFMGYDGFFV